MRASRLAAVGAFVGIGLLLLAVGLFLIGERRMLFASTVDGVAEFTRVSGLQAGAPVRVNGMPAGRVTDIVVPPGPEQHFRVRFAVRDDLHQLVRTDSVATIQTEGLVGGSYLAIGAGSAAARLLPDGGTIRGRDPFEVADLLEQMGGTLTMVNDTIVSLRDDVELVIREVAETTGEINTLVKAVGDDVQAIAGSGRQIAVETEGLLSGLREGRGTAGRLLTDDELYVRVTGIAREAEQTMHEARRVVEEGRLAIQQFHDPAGPAQGMAADVRQTLGHAQSALANLEENTEALKRNFLFRGFFRRRGYFDLHAISAAEYREGALEGGGRHPLRIWLQTERLFDADTGELTDGGRARLDSAMATFLPFVRDAPLVVEGYASGGSVDQQFLASRQRAARVRDYLLQRFELHPNRTGLMPLGARAPDSPGGETWDGVGLALFVERSQLEQRRQRRLDDADAARPAPAERTSAARRQ
jgi:phospholipid/cholesterol/gamma-HCH transport system substrate-binding protein